MAHPRDREFTKFYMTVPRCRSPDLMADSLRPPATCKMEGKWDQMAGRTLPLGSSTLSRTDEYYSPARKHHVKYGMVEEKAGISGCDYQRKNTLFIDLPGKTFNSVSWKQFSQHASAVRSMSSSMRPRSMSVGAQSSFKRSSSRILNRRDD